MTRLKISELLEKYPKLDIGNRIGWTEYIDFIGLDEVTEPVMVGLDRWGRFFMTLQLEMDYDIYLHTIFQRRSEQDEDDLEKLLVMSCGHATLLLFDTIGGMKPAQFDMIKRLLNGEEVVLTEDLEPNIGFKNKKISLYNKKKLESVIIIQRAWRKCRYDPAYTMCKTVQIRLMSDTLGYEFK